jgi:Smg protein
MYYNKILEIIVIILSELRTNKNVNEIDYNALSEIGYTSSEINSALAWIFSKIDIDSNFLKSGLKNVTSKRIYNQEERKIFTPESLGYLIWLNETGILDDADREIIIDRIFLSGYAKVGLTDMKSLIAMYLLDVKDVNTIKTRLILENNDTQN